MDTGDTATASTLPSNADLMREISESFAGAGLTDPYPLFEERRRESPVMAGDVMAEFGAPSMAGGFDGSRPVYTLFRYHDILRVLKDNATFTSQPFREAIGSLLGKVLAGLDGDEHRQMRSMLMPVFSKHNIEEWKHTIVGPVLTDYVGKLREQGGRLDLMPFAIQFPVRIIYEILGFPAEDSDLYETFQSRALSILLGFGSTDPSKAEQARRNKERAVAAVSALYDDLLPIVRRRRSEGAEGNDLIAHLLRAEEDGRRLTDDEVAVFARMLLPAAAETTTRQWSNLMACLLSRPAVLDEVRQDRSLIPKAIDEAVRYEGTAAIGARLCTRDVTFGDTLVPEGCGLTLVRASGNRDESIFDNPNEFDLHRRQVRPPLTFGFGAHMCAGMAIAKLEMAQALNAVLDGLPGLAADPEGPALDITGITLRGPRALPVVWG